MSEKTHWKKVVSNPNYIGEADFKEGQELIVTIKSINQKETVQTAEGKSQKAVVHFAEANVKPMILNVARSESITKVAGSPYFEDWPDVKIQLYIEKNIKAFGDLVNAVRVRPFKPKEAAPIPPCADCNGVIAASNGKSAAWMAAYTTKHYQVPLCADCAMKRKAAAENTSTKEEGNAP